MRRAHARSVDLYLEYWPEPLMSAVEPRRSPGPLPMIAEDNYTHVQTITIEPAPIAAFVNPPADITHTCDEAQNFVVTDLKLHEQ
jgi:hypothetical protein